MSDVTTNFTGNIFIDDSSRFQFLYASQNYGTIYAIYAKFNIEEKNEEINLKYVELILINYKGLIQMGFLDGKKIDIKTTFDTIQPINYSNKIKFEDNVLNKMLTPVKGFSKNNYTCFIPKNKTSIKKDKFTKFYMRRILFFLGIELNSEIFNKQHDLVGLDCVETDLNNYFKY